MLEIIKYQLKERKGAVLLILTVFGILNVIAFGLEISGYARHVNLSELDSMIWVGMACMATGITTLVMFFLCSAGHVDSLLYKDASYLMLTVPRRGWEILGGRFIAGLAEFCVYFIAAGFLASFHLTLLTPAASMRPMNPLSLFGYMYYEVFIVNIVPVLQVAFLGFCGFAVIGTLLTFVVVASRCIVKNKGIATAISIAVFFIITRITTRFGEFLSRKFDWYWNINFKFTPNNALFGGNDIARLSSPDLQTIPIPVAPVIMGLVLAALLFCAASWLMEKKVEL